MSTPAARTWVLRDLRPRSAARSGFRYDIQGLRAVAVAGVVLFHAGVPGMGGGYTGVDVFFVISGYLITDLMRRELDANGTVRFRDFYARRVRRLLPAAMTVLLVTVVLSKLFSPPLTLVSESNAAIASSVYLGNVWFALLGVNYLADTAPSAFQHMWSLGVEEQFYLGWPLLLVLAGGARLKGGRRRLVITLGLLTLVSFVLCVYLTRVLVPIAFFTLPTRAWEFGVGGLLVFARPLVTRLPAFACAVLSWAGAALLVVAFSTLTSTAGFPGYLAAIPVLGAALVIFGGELSPPRGFGSVLQLRPLVFIGTISYSLYLWHWPLLVIPANYAGDELSVSARTGFVVLSVILGYLTYRFVEEPGRTAKRLKHLPGRTLALGAAMTIVCVVASFALSFLPRLTADASVAPPTSVQLQGSPPVPRVVPHNVMPRLEDVKGDPPRIYGDGCHLNYRGTSSPECTYGDVNATQTVVLFGDSRAAQWFPALEQLAEKNEFRLVSFTKSACPSFDLSTTNPVIGGKYVACETWRRESLERIRDLRPSAVVVANFARGYKLMPGVEEEGFDESWARAGTRTLRAIPSSAKTVVLGDTPYWPNAAPNTCLSAHLNSAQECSDDPGELLDRGLRDAMVQAAGAGGATFVDPAPWVCGDRCYGVAWNVLVYHDAVHLTQRMSLLLAPRMEEALNDAMRG